ncbi:hypothetical protein CR513_33477, partial [Mucuna pruriens]
MEIEGHENTTMEGPITRASLKKLQEENQESIEFLSILAHHMRKVREDPRREELDGIKFKIPPVLGECKLDYYLCREMKVDQIFECIDYHKRRKVRLVTLEFIDYFLMWWNQVLSDIRRMRRPPCET